MSALLLQISDTHFGTERPQVCDALRVCNLAQRIAYMRTAGARMGVCDLKKN